MAYDHAFASAGRFREALEVQYLILPSEIRDCHDSPTGARVEAQIPCEVPVVDDHERDKGRDQIQRGNDSRRPADRAAPLDSEQEQRRAGDGAPDAEQSVWWDGGVVVCRDMTVGKAKQADASVHDDRSDDCGAASDHRGDSQHTLDPRHHRS